MRDQLDGIQQVIQIIRKTNLYILDHTPQHKVNKEIVKNPLFRSQSQGMLRFRIYQRRILRIIEISKI